MKCDLDKKFNKKNTLVILAVVFIIFYGFFNARKMIFGPAIKIYSPQENTETENNIANVKGAAENIAFISVNEKPISVDMEGNFEEKLLLYPGSNIINIKARDRFKKEVEKTIKIYYKGPNPEDSEQATSSESI